jgi:hypothetical protein
VTRGYDPRRLQRAFSLACKKLGERHYAVAGNDEPFYYVNLDLDVPCTCADSQYRGSTMCKHELSARLHDGDPQLILALGQMLVVKENNRKEAGLE